MADPPTGDGDAGAATMQLADTPPAFDAHDPLLRDTVKGRLFGPAAAAPSIGVSPSWANAGWVSSTRSSTTSRIDPSR